MSYYQFLFHEVLSDMSEEISYFDLTNATVSSDSVKQNFIPDALSKIYSY